MSTKKYRKSFILLLLTVSFSCGENGIDSPASPELLFSADGLVEHLGGDCSAVQVRTRTLGTADLVPFSELKIDLNGMSDADLSSIEIYYFLNGDQIYLMNLSNRDEINNTRSLQIASPEFSGDLFLRVTLKSSVCTGQIYFLTLRDVKVYGIR